MDQEPADSYYLNRRRSRNGDHACVHCTRRRPAFMQNLSALMRPNQPTVTLQAWKTSDELILKAVSEKGRSSA